MVDPNNRRSNSLGIDEKDIRSKNGTSTELVLDEVFTAEDVIKRAGFGTFQIKLILLSGFVWVAKGFDSVLCSFISSLTTCKWKLSRWHSALLVTITTLSTIIGCFSYGVWADKYGRRMALSSSLIFVFVFGAVSSGLPSYTWFLIFRTVAAFSIGGFPQALTLCCEYMPNGQRGRTVFILSCFWAVGVVIMLGVFYSTVQPYYNHWRLFVACAAIPSGIAMVMMRFFPESIRFLLLSEEYFSASTIAKEMAAANKKNLPHGNLYPSAGPIQKRGRITLLFSDDHRRSTLLFLYMGLATSIAYYALDAATGSITHDEMDEIETFNLTTSNFLGDIYRPVQCLYNVTDNQFIKVVWTNALDFPGFVIYMILVDVIDRKKLLCASCVSISLFIFLLFIQTNNIIMITSFLFCARTLLVGQFGMLLLMTAEAYPTTERGTAVGLEAATFYIGYFITPYIAQGFLDIELRFLIGFCGIIIFLSGIASAFLTWETRGLELMETTRYSN